MKYRITIIVEGDVMAKYRQELGIVTDMMEEDDPEAMVFIDYEPPQTPAE